MEPYLGGVPRCVPINPLLHRFLDDSETQCINVPHGVAYHRQYVTIAGGGMERLYAYDGTASWRKMFIIQAHASALRLMADDSPGEEGDLTHGVTMGEVVDAQKAHLKRIKNETSGQVDPRGHLRPCIAFGLTTELSFTVKGNDIRWFFGGQLDSALKGLCGWDILASR